MRNHLVPPRIAVVRGAVVSARHLRQLLSSGEVTLRILRLLLCASSKLVGLILTIMKNCSITPSRLLAWLFCIESSLSARWAPPVVPPRRAKSLEGGVDCSWGWIKWKFAWEFNNTRRCVHWAIFGGLLLYNVVIISVITQHHHKPSGQPSRQPSGQPLIITIFNFNPYHRCKIWCWRRWNSTTTPTRAHTREGVSLMLRQTT